jgi:hypothetical protein
MTAAELQAARNVLDKDPTADGVECECADGSVWLLHRRDNDGEPRQYVGEELSWYRRAKADVESRRQNAGRGTP